MSQLESYLKTIVKYEIPWCNAMGFGNPYLDPFDTFISKEVPDFDYQAFKKWKIGYGRFKRKY